MDFWNWSLFLEAEDSPPESLMPLAGGDGHGTRLGSFLLAIRQLADVGFEVFFSVGGRVLS